MESLIWIEKHVFQMNISEVEKIGRQKFIRACIHVFECQFV